MTSAKQIAANRANAEKSTGPQTEETKKIVSRNALRHGLTAQVTIMSHEERVAFDNFCGAIVANLAPEGALETQFAQAVADDNWRLNRGRAIENNIFAAGDFFTSGPRIENGHPQIDDALRAAQVFASDPKKFALLALYMQRLHRDMQKSLATLQTLQTERKARRQQDLEEAAALHQLNEIKRLPNPEPGTPSQNGFVFSTPEIRDFLHRKRQLSEAKGREQVSGNHFNNRHKRRNQLRRAA